MRTKEELEVTVNSQLYKKLYKRFVSRKYGYCEICPFNKGENAYGRKDRKSWKRYRKAQFRNKS